VTSPAPSGSSRRRIAGLALVGVGVIAAIIGLASLILGGGGGDGSGTAAPPAAGTPTTVAPDGGTLTPAPPTASGPVVVPTFPSTTAAVAAPPPTEAPPAPADGAGAGGGDQGGANQGGGSGGSGGGSGVSKGPIRVYNNSTITGLASDAAGDFSARGWQVGEVSNYPFGIISTTTVYYRPGTAEQGIAEELGQEFNLRVNPRFEGLKDATPGVIVIVTNDFPRGK
jgi:hypothetical protein